MTIAAEHTFPALSVKIAEGLGIGTSLFLAGIIFTVSYMMVPTLLQPYSPLNQATPSTTPLPVRAVANQFKTIYKRGAATAPPMAIFALANFLYVANAYKQHYHELYQTHGHGHHFGTGHKAEEEEAHLKSLWYTWVSAGILTVSIVPFTFLAIVKVNKKLFELAKEGDSQPMKETSGETTADSVHLRLFLQDWIKLNFIRSAFPLLGGIVGIVALFASKSV